MFPSVDLNDIKATMNKKHSATEYTYSACVKKKRVPYPVGSGQKSKRLHKKLIKIFDGRGVKGHSNGNPNFACTTKVSKRAHNTPSRFDAGWSTKIA